LDSPTSGFLKLCLSKQTELTPPFQWEVFSITNERLFQFPEDDLLALLTKTFFIFPNKFVAVFHEPTFRRDLDAKRHLSDADFAQLVLAMCAVASRFVTDPRVLSDGGGLHSAGSKYFNQITLFHPASPQRANLVQLQTYLVGGPGLFVALSCSTSTLLAVAGIPESRRTQSCSLGATCRGCATGTGRRGA
jgi:hypothetical protein